MPLPDEDLAAIGIRTDEYQRAKAFVGMLKTATNDQLHERAREPNQPEWQRAAVRAEMDHRGI